MCLGFHTWLSTRKKQLHKILSEMRWIPKTSKIILHQLAPLLKVSLQLEMQHLKFLLQRTLTFHVMIRYSLETLSLTCHEMHKSWSESIVPCKTIQFFFQVHQFFLPHAQEKHSSIYVSIWACASSANKNRTYCSSSRTYYHINAVTEMEIGDVFTNRSVYSVKDCCKPLLLFLDHFFLSRTFFLHLLHSAGHASIHFSMPSFFPIYGRDLSWEVSTSHGSLRTSRATTRNISHDMVKMHKQK